ncbi:hypothetical protein HII13_005195 [Brettanomyces bruxellensis]|uniref:DEBR0S3_03290g1_1 n=1 Tax=Dekkera bruxellensis TaxID=5007 RepID=A0A7D9GZK2_DEKBR|nr:hypothetical protein HII13_005195 [Brettanomyces bruxellensis]VUG18141.1 DEBR0S3_03290g1_1 [Brettanomyces bruxellensis]
MGRLEQNPLYKALSSSNTRPVRSHHRLPKSERLVGNPIEEALIRAKEKPLIDEERKLLNNPLAVALLKGKSKKNEGRFRNGRGGSAHSNNTIPTSPAGPNRLRRSRHQKNDGSFNRTRGRREHTYNKHARERVKENIHEKYHKRTGENKSQTKEFSTELQTPEKIAAALKKSNVGVWSSSNTSEKHVSFKGASKPSFLRIQNLQPGVTELDIVEIMWRYGTVLKVITKESVSRNYGRSVTAELFYVNDESMWKAKKALDGVNADNRILKLEIAQDPVTVTNSVMWRGITSEVREAKRNRMMSFSPNPADGLD